MFMSESERLFIVGLNWEIKEMKSPYGYGTLWLEVIELLETN